MGPIDSSDSLSPTSASAELPILPYTAIDGPVYVTAQTLIQQVAYALSDKLFAYSPKTFDLEVAAKKWAAAGECNANGYVTAVQQLETRQGAGTIALGYIFSPDFDVKKRHIPQTILASSATLQYLRNAIEQLSLVYVVSNPFVAHIAAVDYVGGPDGHFVTDYNGALRLSEDLGLGLVSSLSTHDSQHMALFSTLISSVLPTIHIYDGLKVGREFTRVVDALDQTGLKKVSDNVLKALEGPTEKRLDSEGKLLRLLGAFNDELGTDYGLFEYHGHPEATSVLVSFGTTESALTSQLAESLTRRDVRVGAVNVRVYRPFVEDEFLKVLPTSVETIGVLGQVPTELDIQEEGVHSALYEDVLASLTFGRVSVPNVVEIKYSPSTPLTPLNATVSFQRLIELSLDDLALTKSLELIDNNTVQQYSFWDVDTSTSQAAASLVAQTLSKDSTKNISTNTTFDNLVQGGMFRTDIRRSQRTLNAPYSVEAADVSYVGEIKILSDLDIASNVRDAGYVIVNASNLKDEDLEKKLPLGFRKAVSRRGISLFALDMSSVEYPIFTILAAFLRVAAPETEAVEAKKVAAVLSNPDAFQSVTNSLSDIFRKVEVPEAWGLEDPESEQEKLPIDIRATSFASFEKDEPELASDLGDWQSIAKSLAFKEAYATRTALRPDISTKTYTVHVKENRRLTPESYERNIFHIEFDIGDSGLKYDIGEALGIHAENRKYDVEDFISFYGLDPEAVVEIPTRDNTGVFESRTVYQALQYNIDLWGRPPKRFYEALAPYATVEKEAKELSRLASAEGTEDFKTRAEVHTVTYADLLREFPSAHPSFHDLVQIVNPMKRREYSIASCQKVTPQSVALMIVVVDWTEPSGRKRVGQASHYLSRLAPGAPVTVSVKPSVMKLPPSPSQPLIMAGLGTGLAPFRAFVQHRALEKAMGVDVGPVLLYMGSRHQREEYCYGEEWEAYQDAGIITLLGRAFSRDQPHKVYIQDRMRETLPQISQAYVHEKGAFYLCGPTWPVPDVTQVLEEAIQAEASKVGKKVDTRREIEQLKEETRYVLEVY